MAAFRAVTDARFVARFSRALTHFHVIAITSFLLVALASGLALAETARTPEQAADAWLERVAEDSADGISEELKKLEKNIPIETDLRDAIKGTLKSAIKSKLSEGILNEVASPAMYDILAKIREAINEEKPRNRCQAAAIGAAFSALGIRRVLDGAAQAFPEILGSAIGGAGLIENIIGTIADKVRSDLEAWLDNYMKDYRIETFSRTTSAGPCPVTVRVVWNKTNGKFSFVVLGDCACADMPVPGSTVKLSRWSISGEGRAASVGEEVERANAGQNSLRGAPRVTSVTVNAVCCDPQGQPPPRTAADPFVFPPPPQRVQVPPQTEQPRPRTATGPRPLTLEEMNANNRNAARSGRVPTIPNGPVCEEQKREFIQQAVDAKLAANDRLEAAQSALDDVKADQRAGKEVSDETLGNALEAVEIARERARVAQDALEKAEKLETTDCPKQGSFVPGTPLLPDGQEYAYRLAIEIPEKCEATIVYVRETTVTTTPVIVDEPQVAIPEEEQPPAEAPPEFGLPVCIPEGIEKGPVEIVTGGSSTPTPPPEESPATETPPVGEPPATPEQPAQSVPREDTPSLTEVPPGDEETPTPTTPPDLGLAKVEERVVQLVLTGTQTGEPVDDAVVKLLEPAPALPGAGEEDPALRTAEQYEEDVPAAAANDQGETEIALVEEESEPPSAAANAEEASLAGITPIRKDISIDTAPAKQFVIALNSPMSKLPDDIKLISSAICLKRTFELAKKPVLVVNVPEEKAVEFTTKVKTFEDISFIEEDPCRKKEDEADPYQSTKGLWGQDFDDQWAIKRVGFDKDRKAFAPPKKSEPAIVAVIDTGVDWYHPDLPASIFWKNPKEVRANRKDDDGNGYVDDMIGWNFIDHDNLPWDYDGHGTFVTGVIAAGRGNGIGIAGINPSARIMVLRALDAFGRGHASTIAEAIAYAADNGARIINLSLGGRGLTQIEQLAVDHAKTAGAILVVAAGNDGEEVAGYSPAGLAGVVTVSATDRNDRRVGFSNWGPAVDIAAPGIDVLSLRARNTDLLSFIKGVKYEVGKAILGPDRAYYRASGTSFAAPIVSGTLSLLLSQDPKLTSEQMQRMIFQSAGDIETPGFDNYTGYGLLDADKALMADPNYFVESRISGVKVVTNKDGKAVRVYGTTNADSFKDAVVMIGQGSAPTKWLKVNKPIKTPVTGKAIIDLPAKFFSGAQEWTIRLITHHENGTQREARFLLRLG